MPLLTIPDGAPSTTIHRNIQFLLTYHQIPEGEATTITFRFTQFVNPLMLSRRNNTLITDLQSSVRWANQEDENEDCTICLQIFRGREDINTIAYNHIFYDLYIAQSKLAKIVPFVGKNLSKSFIPQCFHH